MGCVIIQTRDQAFQMLDSTFEILRESQKLGEVFEVFWVFRKLVQVFEKFDLVFVSWRGPCITTSHGTNFTSLYLLWAFDNFTPISQAFIGWYILQGAGSKKKATTTTTKTKTKTARTSL